MEELQDYNGEFRPDLKLQDFSKDALVQIAIAGAKQYIGLDGLWVSLLREKFGEQVALDLDTKNWEKMSLLEYRFARESLNIQGDDVATLFKLYQIDPGVFAIMDCAYELKNKNHGIFTVKRCISLEYFERRGEAALLERMCHVIEEAAINRYAQAVNPKMKATPLKLPPRKNKDEIACIWEMKIEA